MRKEALTFDRHASIGRELKDVRERLLELRVEIGRHYPKASGSNTKASRACEAVEGLRCALDSQLFSDYPEQFGTHVYYGPES